MADEAFKVTVGQQGRLVVPAQLREALDLQPGDVLLAHVDNNRHVLERRQAILARIQERFATAVPAVVNLADKLIADRRQEVKREGST